jgi:hypothetical protein
VFYTDLQLANAAACALGDLPFVLKAWVQPNLGVGVEFYPAQTGTGQLMAELARLGLL